MWLITHYIWLSSFFSIPQSESTPPLCIIGSLVHWHFRTQASCLAEKSLHLHLFHCFSHDPIPCKPSLVRTIAQAVLVPQGDMRCCIASEGVFARPPVYRNVLLSTISTTLRPWLVRGSRWSCVEPGAMLGRRLLTCTQPLLPGPPAWLLCIPQPPCLDQCWSFRCVVGSLF